MNWRLKVVDARASDDVTCLIYTQHPAFSLKITIEKVVGIIKRTSVSSYIYWGFREEKMRLGTY